ncbi:MAG: TonB-dependent receptor, partial [Bacteroidota bacterium]
NFSSRYYRQLNFKTWTGRVNAKYKLTDKHELTFNHNIISENRIGSDTLEIIFGTDIDPNSLPSDYTRNVSGLGLSSVILNDKIKNVVTAKRFSVSTASTSRLQGGFFIDGTLVEVEKASYGIGNSTKVKIGSNRFIRVSYEYATRIPENIEFLGDGLFVLGNPGLKPETSHNVNTGFFSNLGKQKKHWIDVNLFYRFIMDNIFLEQAGFSEAVFRNQDDARVYGAELSIRGEIIRSLRYNFSTTYQDIRRANSRELNLESAREPNIPYFFSNLGLRYNHSRELLRGNWDAYLNYGFIEKYLLTTLPKELEPALFGPVDKVRSTTIIDTQHTLDLGVTYSYTKMPLWVSFEVNNVLDIPVFDGFRVQLPGRNFRLKLKCRINGK